MSWKERIEAAKIEGSFSHQDLRDAGEFGSCAVGEVLNKVGVKPSYVGCYPPLWDAGFSMYSAVIKQNMLTAEVVYAQIQQLGALLEIGMLEREVSV